jgi:HTH-type transcriptional regulator / antitoxin HipB
MKVKSSRSAGLQRTPAWAAELGAAVREKRKALRLTQKELAELAQCGPDFLYDLERGKPTVRLDKLVPVLEMLGLRFKVEPK